MEASGFRRREFLTTAGVGVTAVVTGCNGGSNEATPELPFEREVDPSRTYLRTRSDNAGGAQPIDLTDLAVEPGLSVRLERLGTFNGSSGGTGMIAVFSGSSELGSADTTERVVDAIDAGEDYETIPTYNGNAKTDVPEDFLVADNDDGEQTSTTVTVPDGATHLFVAAIDNLYQDNTHGDTPFAIRIESA